MITRSERCNPRRHLVQIGVVRRQSGNALPALQQRIHRAKRFAHDLLHAHEPAPNALFRQLKDRGLGIAQHIFGRIALVRRPRNRRVRR